MSEPVQLVTIEWGKIEVRSGGELLAFKDCKAWPSGAKEWDWSLTGTRHQPGIQSSDIEELLEHDVDLVILSRGMQLVLQTSPGAIEYLKSIGMKYQIEETKAAVAIFNEQSRLGRRVAGLFHSTC